MGAPSRSYERRVMASNPTLVPQRAAIFIPSFLATVLLFLLVRLIPDAKVGILAFHQQIVPIPGQAGSPAMGPNEHTPNLTLFTVEVRSWSDEIMRWSKEHDIPPTLVALVMQIESCGAPNVTSSAGAMGLFQVMPFHFSSTENPYDPEVNASRGLEYLARSYNLAEGSIDTTLAGYNGGHSVIEWEPSNWAEETKRYVLWGTGIWDEILAHENRSDTLDQWLAAGGSNLCLQARNSLALP